MYEIFLLKFLMMNIPIAILSF